MIQSKLTKNLFWGLLLTTIIGVVFVLKSDEIPLNTDNGFTEPAQKTFFENLARAAENRTTHTITYDPSYTKLAYPGGDVAANKGVCSDVVIRSYRTLGIDLQQLIHEDMRDNFNLYPKKWGLKEPDSNIDHRRVSNIMTFFSRFGKTLSPSRNANDYAPGDIVAWDLGRGITHIGVVSNQKAPNTKRYKLVHNIGSGPTLEDVLFSWKIIGHYRYQ